MNYIKPYNFYDKLKAKNKKYVTNKTYFDLIISCVSSSFIYAPRLVPSLIKAFIFSA